MNRGCFPMEKHQNSQKWAKFMNFSFRALSLVWFAGATPEKNPFLDIIIQKKNGFLDILIDLWGHLLGGGGPKRHFSGFKAHF